MSASPRHLLVRLPNPLGDAVLATPALRALRRALPGTRITWAGGPAALAVLQGLGGRDDVVPVAGPFARGLLAPLRAGRMWRRVGPDAVLLLTHSFSSAFAARVARAPRRVGAALHGRGWLLTERVSLARAGRRLEPRPMTQMYLDLVRPFGATDDGAGLELVVEPFDHERAHARLGDAAPDVPILAVNPGASFGATKIYPPDALGAAVGAVLERTRAQPLVLCGPGEEALGARVVQAIPGRAIGTHDAPPDVGELKALLARSKVLITTDAGPRHVAEALGVPTVVVMGPTDPRWTANSPARVLRQEDLSCLGCHLSTCPIGHPCMERLDPARVAAAALAALGGEETGGGPAGG